MNAPRRARGVWRPELGWFAMALAAVAAGLWMWTLGPESDESAAPATPPPVRIAAAPAPAVPTAPATSSPLAATPTPPAASNAAPQAAAREPDGDLTPDISVFVNKGERPTMAEVIDRLHQTGVRSGLGAFLPPGTRPPLIGLAVPEDFALPEGYVRHHQATDDGQRIEAILMFAPGAQLVDAAGNPIAMPADRVVPPELAPPGLPIRRIEIPPPAPEPGK